MDKNATLQALLRHGIDFTGHADDDAALLYHAQHTNPFSVSTGELDGKFFATTRRSTEAWTDSKGVEHPAVDRSSFYVYGESPGHAAALLLLNQVSVYRHDHFTMNWKYAASSR